MTCPTRRSASTRTKTKFSSLRATPVRPKSPKPRRSRSRTASSIWSWSVCRVTDDLARELELLRDFGFTHLDIRQPITDNRQPTTDLLGELRNIVIACEKCRLAKTRTQVVYGVGNPNADLMFIGE